VAVAAAAVQSGRNPIVSEDRRAGWVFILPAMTIFTIFIFGAILFAIYLSLHDYKLLQQGGIWQVFTDPGNTWVGIGNYQDLFGSTDFWRAFRNTTWYALFVVPLQTITGLVLAVFANRKIRGKSFFRTAFYFRRSAPPSSSRSSSSGCTRLGAQSTSGSRRSASSRFGRSGWPTPRACSRWSSLATSRPGWRDRASR
jgi:hypothetical protein